MRLLRLLRFFPVLLPGLCLAGPEAVPNALPEAIPEALPQPEPDAEAQSYYNNAPFSGAIYIVGPDGGPITTANTNMCPAEASLSCSSMGSPSWCCPSGYTCAVPANSGGLIGCCPSGSSCGGSVNAASVTTVTVYAQQQTSVVYVQPQASTVVVYNQPPPTTVAVYNVPAQTVNVAAGYCSTLTMNGPGLPTTTQGACGTILIVNEGMPSTKAVGLGMGVVMILLHIAVGRLFHRV